MDQQTKLQLDQLYGIAPNVSLEPEKQSFYMQSLNQSLGSKLLSLHSRNSNIEPDNSLGSQLLARSSQIINIPEQQPNQQQMIGDEYNKLIEENPEDEAIIRTYQKEGRPLSTLKVVLDAKKLKMPSATTQPVSTATQNAEPEIVGISNVTQPISQNTEPSVGKSIVSGIYNVVGGLYGAGKMAFEGAYWLAAQPQNAIAKTFNVDALLTDKNKLYESFPIIKSALDISLPSQQTLNYAQGISSRQYYDRSMVDYLKDKDYKSFGKLLGYQVIENLPQQAVIWGTAIATGNPLIGTAIISGQAAGGKYETINKDMPEYAKFTNALSTGMTEYLTESYLGTVPILRSLMGRNKQLLKSGVKEAIKDYAKNTGKAFAEEGFEETVSQFTENIVDILSNNRDKNGNLPDIFSNVADATFIGGVTGGLLGAGGTTISRTEIKKQQNTIKEVANTLGITEEEANNIIQEIQSEQPKEANTPEPVILEQPAETTGEMQPLSYVEFADKFVTDEMVASNTPEEIDAVVDKSYTKYREDFAKQVENRKKAEPQIATPQAEAAQVQETPAPAEEVAQAPEKPAEIEKPSIHNIEESIKQAKKVEYGQPFDNNFETRQQLRKQAGEKLKTEDLFNALSEKTRKSLESRKSDLFYKGESWKRAIEQSAINADMWVSNKETFDPNDDRLIGGNTVQKYYLLGADNNRTYRREIPKEYFDYFNSIKERYNSIIDRLNTNQPIAKTSLEIKPTEQPSEVQNAEEIRTQAQTTGGKQTPELEQGAQKQLRLRSNAPDRVDTEYAKERKLKKPGKAVKPSSEKAQAKVSEKEPWQMTRNKFNELNNTVKVSKDYKYNGQDMPWTEKMSPWQKAESDMYLYHFSDDKIKGFVPKETSFFIDRRSIGHVYRIKIKKDRMIHPSQTGEELRINLNENDLLEYLGEDTYKNGHITKSNSENNHESIIQQALSEGKPVPPEVLADYPDLAKSATKQKAGIAELPRFLKRQAQPKPKRLIRFTPETQKKYDEWKSGIESETGEISKLVGEIKPGLNIDVSRSAFDSIKGANEIYKSLFKGKDIVVLKSPAEFDGVQYKDRIFVSSNADDPANVVFTHELMHEIDKNSPELYQVLKNLFRDELKVDMQTIRDSYKSMNIDMSDLSDEELLNEALNDYVSKNLNDKGFWETLHTKSASLAQKLIDAIKAILNKIRSYFKSGNVNDFVNNTDSVINMAESVIKEYMGGKQVGETVKPEFKTAPIADTFYMQSERIVANKFPEKMSGRSVMNWLRNNQVKPEELEWLGIEDFANNKLQVTKQQLLDYIKSNEIKVEEVIKEQYLSNELGDLKDEYQEKVDELEKVLSRLEHNDEHIWRLEEIKRNGEDLGAGGEQELEEAYSISDKIEEKYGTKSIIEEKINEIKRDTDHYELEETEATTTEYGQYQEPGGENYRELLLTMPSNYIKPLDKWQFYLDKGYTGEQYAELPFEKRNELFNEWKNESDKLTSKSKTDYRSSHFDEPNILAHVRFNERTDTDGNKVLFIEEIQSDWAQKGKEKGYDTGKEKDVYDIAHSIYITKKHISLGEIDKTRGQALLNTYKNKATDKGITEEQLRDALEKYGDFTRTYDKGVPNMPFKSEKSWSLLAFKRMIRWATENGFDKIAWTTGEMQAARYDMSKQVEKIRWDSGNERLYVTRIGESEELLANDVRERDLVRYIGKDAAKKLIESDWDEEYSTAVKTLSGVDLKIGGAGMKSFYDEKIKGFVDKYVKQWGSKVESANVSDMTVPSITITPEMQRTALREGQPMFKRSSDLETKIRSDIDKLKTEKILGKQQRIKILKSNIANYAKVNPVEGKSLSERVTDLLDKINSSSVISDIERDFNAIKKAVIISDMAKRRESPAKETTEERDPVKVLGALLKSAKPMRGKLEKIYTEERGKRITKVWQAFDKIGGEEGYKIALSELKGELASADQKKISFESIKDKLTDDDVKSLYNKIFQHPYLDVWEKLNAANGLTDLFDGEIPQPSKLVLLEEVYGSDLIKTILSKRALGLKLKDLIVDIINLPKLILSSADMSGFLRQGVVEVAAHPLISSKAMAKTFQFAFSPKSFEQYFKDLEKDPLYPIIRNSKLAITDPSRSMRYTHEEAFISRLAQQTPIIGHLLRFSERSYVGFLNKLRVDVFKSFVDELLSRGYSPIKNEDVFKSAANIVNTFTGRGSLGRFDRIVPELNTIFFSPRLIAARFNTLNPIWYAKQNKAVRLKAIGDFAKFVVAGLTLISLLSIYKKMYNKSDKELFIESDPRSSDFGKIKSGNTRWDIWGGFQQWVRVFSQVISGKRKSTRTGKLISLTKEEYPFTTRKEVALRFIEGKLAPIPALMNDLISGAKNYGGEDLTPSMVAKEKFIPLYIQDILEAYQDGGMGRAVGAGVPAFFGVGVQTYKDKPKPKIIDTGKGMEGFR